MKISEPLNEFNKIHFKYPVIKSFISVIIPVYKDVNGLDDTLKSIRGQTLSQNLYEIIVANDGADKEITNLCNSYNVKEIKVSPNLGSYNARNKALVVSKGEYLAFTDADVIVPNEWLEKGRKSIVKYDYVGSLVKFPDKKKLSLADKWENLFEFNMDYSFKKDFYCVTANLFVKRKVIEIIGGFDNRLQSGGDMEFGNKVHLVNIFTQILDKTNPVIHPHRNYFEILKKKKRVAQGINDLVNLFPERFSHYRYVLFDEVIQLIFPPIKFLNNINILLFLWHFKFIDIYLNLKYRHKHMLLFHPTSKIRKVLKLFQSN